jgi:hypothetical protein
LKGAIGYISQLFYKGIGDFLYWAVSGNFQETIAPILTTRES